MKDAYVKWRAEEEEKQAILAAEEELKQREREEKMANLSKEKAEKLKKLFEEGGDDIAISDMPDCDLKYEKILEQFSPENQYTDPDFTANDSSVGGVNFPNDLDRPTSWQRASERPDCVLYD